MRSLTLEVERRGNRWESKVVAAEDRKESN
jgi:hypothetical protein